MSSSKKWTGHYLLLFGIAVAFIIFDQWSKGLVRQNIALGEEIYPIAFLAPFFRFTYWQNTGAAFGIFQNANIPLLILSTIISVLIIVYYHKSYEEPLVFKISLGLLLAGAVGNIIDRVRFGFVTDFISVGRFAVFNVADSCVTVGVSLMLLGILIHEQKEKSVRKAMEIEQDGTNEN
jgi:signal peptidase II